MADNYFVQLNSINVNDKTEKKNGLTYLSWAFAWGEVKKRFPDATYTIYENQDGWNYFTDGRTCWVKTGVTVNGIEHIEYLPVMDFKNHSIKVDDVTSYDVNKTIQRSLTKAVARHGLGLYIYAGEDLPESDDTDVETKPAPKTRPQEEVHCNICDRVIQPYIDASGKTTSVKRLVERSRERFNGQILCADCARDYIKNQGGN